MKDKMNLKNKFKIQNRFDHIINLQLMKINQLKNILTSIHKKLKSTSNIMKTKGQKYKTFKHHGDKNKSNMKIKLKS